MNKLYELGQLCDIGSSKRIHLADYVEHGIPFYRSREIIELSSGKKISEKLFISQDQFDDIKNKYDVPQIDDILITSVGTIGVTYLVTDNNFYFKDGNLTWLKKIKKDVVGVKFLIKWLKSSFFLKQINNNNIGAVQKALTIDYLRKVQISLPNLVNQKKIAAVLSALDDKIELNNQINAELEAMAKTLYDYWFVQFDFPYDFGPFDSAQGAAPQNVTVTEEHSPVAERSRTVAERSRGYRSSGGKMVYNEVLKREIPEGWGFMTIGDLGNVLGGSTPSKGDDSNFCTNGTSWITPKDLSINSGKKFITRGEVDVSEKGLKEASLNILPKNSVLMSSRAPVGYLAINRKECTTNQGFKSIVCDKGFPAEYVFYVLQHHMKTIEANATGSTFKEISGTVFKSINIIKPQQKEIVQFVEKVRPIFERQNNLELQNQALAQLRDWLLPMLMNGQVRVGEIISAEDLSLVAEEVGKYKKKKV